MWDKYCFNYLYRTDESQIKHIIDSSDIRRIEERCREAEESIKAIRQALYEQVNRLQELQVEKYILVRRYRPWKGNIEITVTVETKETLGDYYRTIDQRDARKLFTGTEKKQALAYAEELKKKHNVRVIKDNWK